MSKYDEKFKQKVVDAYLSGEGGYGSLAKKFGIPSKQSVKKWVFAFKQFGSEGLIRKKTNSTYSVQFKLDVLNYKLRTEDSFQDVALKFNIPELSIICNWFRMFQDKGVEGLSGTKGRPSLSKKSKNKKLTKEQQLEKEIELLKAENAYLKKLRASGIDIPSRLLK